MFGAAWDERIPKASKGQLGRDEGQPCLVSARAVSRSPATDAARAEIKQVAGERDAARADTKQVLSSDYGNG